MIAQQSLVCVKLMLTSFIDQFNCTSLHCWDELNPPHNMWINLNYLSTFMHDSIYITQQHMNTLSIAATDKYL